MTDFASLPIPPRLTPAPPPDDDALINTPLGNDSNSHSDDTLLGTEIIPFRRSIYPSTTHPGFYRTHITPYNPLWPSQFTPIATHLSTLFRTSNPPATYTTIEHIGSTAIPNLCAKPNIDVLVTLPSQLELNKAIDALNWEIPTAPPFTRYTQCPRRGGIAGRESFKIYLPVEHPWYAETVERSVYMINANEEENAAGQVQIRVHRTFREVLMKKENEDLFEEYAQLKWRLSEELFNSSIKYAARKDGVVRKILMRGGWTAEEVDKKERLSRRELMDDGDEPY